LKIDVVYILLTCYGCGVVYIKRSTWFYLTINIALLPTLTGPIRAIRAGHWYG
jgi:hypothetical protein